jgi:hypothetical protein
VIRPVLAPAGAISAVSFGKTTLFLSGGFSASGLAVIISAVNSSQKLLQTDKGEQRCTTTRRCSKGAHNCDAGALSKELREYSCKIMAEQSQLRVAGVQKTLIPVDGSEGALLAPAYVIGSVSHRAPPQIDLLNVQPRLMRGDIGPGVTVEIVRHDRLVAGKQALRRA